MQEEGPAVPVKVAGAAVPAAGQALLQLEDALVAAEAALGQHPQPTCGKHTSCHREPHLRDMLACKEW